MSRMLPYERRDRDVWGVGFGEELFSDSLQACFRLISVDHSFQHRSSVPVTSQGLGIQPIHV